MEERIIKKTAELIYKDIKKVAQPVINGIKKLGPFLLSIIGVMIKGFISSASIILLNKKGYQIFRYIEIRLIHNGYRDTFFVFFWLFNVMLTIFFGDKVLTMKPPFILLLLVSHSIGFVFVIKDYITHKQQQAIEELNEKKTKTTKNQKGGINT